MRCVKCDQVIANPGEPCPHCHFSGDVALVEELGHVKWLLGQIPTLTKTGVPTVGLEQHYKARRRELEIQLGLRLPSPTREQARELFVSLVHEQALVRLINQWLAANWVNRDVAAAIMAEVEQQIRGLHQQLEGPRFDYPRTDAERLAVVEFLLAAINRFSERNGFVSANAEQSARAVITAQKAKLETELARRRPQPIRSAAAPQKPATSVESVPAQASPVPPAPILPLRDRFWRTLLSERTLQAMLFLGIFLLLAAALSFVFYGWKDFSALLRVAIPTIFTLVFLALGWYVRTRTRMYRSGIALTAMAALLIPIDFYTLYVNFNISPAQTPTFWFITSLVCLAAYIIITLLTQSALFGYLVGVAAGAAISSAVEIGNQQIAFARDWNGAALTILALGLSLIAAALGRASKPGRWRVLAEPFRNLALIAVGAIMLLTWGGRYLDRKTYDTLHYSMTISWWLGGLLFGWGAIHYRSRTLGILAALTLPIATFMAQAAIFDQARISPAWHAFGLALLVPIYLTVGNKLLARKQDRVLYGHGRTATGWGVALTIVAALWSLTNLTSSTAAASSHAVLAGAMLLALFLWQRPRILYAASLFALTTTAFVMTELNLSPNQFSIGWASLAIVYIVVAVAIGTRAQAEFAKRLTTTVVNAGFVIAALALLPPLLPYNGTMLSYALGNWLGLTAWSARLAHLGRVGFVASGRFGRSRFHWLTAPALPVWVWVIFANRGPLDFSLPLALSALAWGMVALSYRLSIRRPWYSVGLLVSVIAPIAAFLIDRNGFAPAICLLAAGLLYLADAITNRWRWELLPGALVTAWGLAWLLDHARVNFDAVTFAVAALVALYVLAGLRTEHRKSPTLTRRFLVPLYWASHLLTFILLVRVGGHPLVLRFSSDWTNEMRVWEAASCILLGMVYALYAWGTFTERWAHAAAWLLIAGGGLVAVSKSTGSGTLAAEAALGAVVYVLAERVLNSPPSLLGKGDGGIGRLWRLYHRPLLVAGWSTSVLVIGLALGRNLILLGGGRTQQIWAVVGTTLIVALYALSARLFRRARFVWFAAALSFIPWTIMTNLGWLVGERPRTPAFAISWVILAWLLFLTSLIVRRFAASAYATPLRVLAHILLPFSLLWGVADASTSRITFALAIPLYALEAMHHATRPSGWKRTAFLYPALGLVPIWSVYLFNLLPGPRHEHYGLMLLVFGVLGMVVGQWLERVAARDFGLPAYLTGYIATIVGTLLVAHDAALLSLVLVYDALLMLASARLFKSPLWTFAAATIAPFSFWLALNQSSVPGNRHGWWLMALAAIYLLVAWALRRARLAPHSTAPLTIAFALIAFALPPSTQDKVGAFWGYAGAAILYAVTAFWLRQPLLLTPACALVVVPYAIGLQESALPSDYYGLALLPGAVVALGIAWLLDTRFRAWRDFPWSEPLRWGMALAERLLNWWALPFYALSFGLAVAGPFFDKPGGAALNWLLIMPLSAWAIYRFRLRVWLFATVLAGHLAALFYLYDLGWWRFPAEAALRFLPVTLVTTFIALAIERRRKEGPPLSVKPSYFTGWSHPLYLIVLIDIFEIQMTGFGNAQPGALISLAHALLLAVLASFWLSGGLPYLSTILGTVALVQWMTTQAGPTINAPIPLAELALAYGLVGYALAFWRERRELPKWLAIWDAALQRSGVWLSIVVLVLAGVLGLNLAQWTLRAMLGLPFRQIVELATVQMVVSVLALLGLLYVAAAFIHRRRRVGYTAIAMLLSAWMLFAFYIQQWDGAPNAQWYALPAGLYLLGVSFFEFRRGNRNLARWIDYAAVVLMMGSLFWQTLLFGWSYALMLGAEGFAAFWWGSARRLRRFLYAGMMGVVLATLAQLINSLQSINQWLVFGIIGSIIVVAAILIERKMEEIKSLRQILETWE